MQDLSRCRWVSTKPLETRRPFRSIVLLASSSRGAIAAILPATMPISQGSALVDSRVLQDEVHGHPRCQALA